MNEKTHATPSIRGSYTAQCIDCERLMNDADKDCKLCTDCKAIHNLFDKAFGTEPNKEHLDTAMTKMANCAMSVDPKMCVIMTYNEVIALSLEIRRLNRKANAVSASGEPHG